ncbi:MAG: Mitotic spindle checkpoint component mad2 [Chrysothrix sp. TS-e1954]|nr:MAG: Mitotic spindle checkpoint component mad2 [Chrysothrix sp. TS-e1954]
MSSKPTTTTTKPPPKLPLTGSPTLITEFFSYSLHSILFQRGVYPPEDFAPVKKYGINMLVSTDDAVKAYLRRITRQLERWMRGGKVSRLVLVLTEKEGGEDVERWQFDVDCFDKSSGGTKGGMAKAKGKGEEAAAGGGDEGGGGDENKTHQQQQAPKTDEQIQAEIRALFRQITASVTFLPTLTNPCTFNVLVYADADSEVPLEWGDSDAKEIEGAEKVKLRGFSTESHRVETFVLGKRLEEQKSRIRRGERER